MFSVWNEFLLFLQLPPPEHYKRSSLLNFIISFSQHYSGFIQSLKRNQMLPSNVASLKIRSTCNHNHKIEQNSQGKELKNGCGVKEYTV